jgi:hypothetical protein
VLTEIYGEEDWTAVRKRKAKISTDSEVDDESVSAEHMAEMI